MREYYGGISFSGRINFGVKASSEEEARELVYSLITMQIDSDNKEVLDVSDVEWDLITMAPRGNVATNFVSDFEIYEED